MATISTLAYKIVADTQNFLQGVKLSRTEMQAAKQVFKDSIDPVTAYKAELDALAGLHAKGALSAEQYAAAVARTAAKSDPAVIAQREAEAIATQTAADAAKEREAVLQRGLALSQSLATPEEQRAMRLKESKDLLDQAAISQEDFNRAVKQLDTEKYQEAHDKLKGIGDSLTSAGMQMTAVGAGITAAFGGTAYAAMTAAAEYEQTTIAFSTLMGSAEKAQATLADLTEFAAATPFQMPELQTVARGLLGFGIEGEALIEQIRIMGDAAAATNTPIGELGQIFVKVRGAGRLMGDTFAQLSERGIMFHKDIAEHFGIAESEVAKFISAGKVGFPEVEAIMRKLTSEGGRYSGAMVDLSESAMGLSSTLKDNVSIALRGIGEELLPMQKAMTSWANGMVQGLTQLDGGTRRAAAYTIALGVAMGGVITASGLVIVVTGKVVTWYAAATLMATKYAAAKWALVTATVAAKVAMYGMGVALAALPGIILYQLMPSIREYNAALKESKRLSDELSKRDTGQREQVMSVAMELPEADRLEHLQAELDKAKLNAEGLSSRSKMAKEEADRIAPTWLSLGQAGRKMWQVQVAEYDELRKRYGESNEFVIALEKEIAKLSGTRIEQPAIDQAKIADAVKKTTDTINEQIATIGMNKDELELWKLKQEEVGETAREAVAALQEQRNALEAKQDLSEDYDKMVLALEKQIATTGMSADEIARMELASRNLHPTLLANIEALQTDLAAKQQLEETRQEVDKLNESLADQLFVLERSVAGWSPEAIERAKLAQQGVSAETLENIAVTQEQIAILQKQKEAQDETAQAQESLRNSLADTRKGLQEQIATYGMKADEVALWRLKQQGATDDELAGIQAMQDELAALQAQKDAMKASDTTIGAGSLADAYDAIQRAREANETRTVTPPVVEVPEIPEPPPIVPPSTVISVSWAEIPPPPVVPSFAVDMTGQPTTDTSMLGADLAYMGQAAAYTQQVQDAATTFAGPQPVIEPTSQKTAAQNEVQVSPEVPLLARIAAGIDALVRKEGIVIEEVNV